MTTSSKPFHESNPEDALSGDMLPNPEPGGIESADRQFPESTIQMIDQALNSAARTSLSDKVLSKTNHEIRTALNDIVGMAQLISDTQLTPEQRSCVNTIHQATQTLLKTVNYVLDVSKIEAGKMETNESAVDLRTMCKKMDLTFNPLAVGKALNFSCRCNDSVPLSVMCDKDLMERVLSALLKNALENTEKGSVTLEIECLRKGPKGAELVFSITDTGCGMDSELKEAILSEPASAGNDACGMGLTISRQLIEIMNGTLELISSKGEGSTISIHLTFRQANRPAPMKLADSDRIKTILKPNLRILLAEDNLVNQKTTSRILQKAGCEVDTAENGNIAVQKIKTTPYDLIMMDCQMPIMDGYEATAKIRTMDKPACLIPIIAVTANAMGKDKQKCLASGMNAYLTKPIERQELIDLINAYTADERSVR